MSKPYTRQLKAVPRKSNIARLAETRIALARAQHILQQILDDEQGWSTRDVERALMAIEEVMP